MGLSDGTSGRVSGMLGKLLENKVPTAVTILILLLPGQKKMQAPKPGVISLLGRPWPIVTCYLTLYRASRKLGPIAP